MRGREGGEEEEMKKEKKTISWKIRVLTSTSWRARRKKRKLNVFFSQSLSSLTLPLPSSVLLHSQRQKIAQTKNWWKRAEGVKKIWNTAILLWIQKFLFLSSLLPPPLPPPDFQHKKLFSDVPNILFFGRLKWNCFLVTCRSVAIKLPDLTAMSGTGAKNKKKLEPKLSDIDYEADRKSQWKTNPND